MHIFIYIRIYIYTYIYIYRGNRGVASVRQPGKRLCCVYVCIGIYQCVQASTNSAVRGRGTK